MTVVSLIRNKNINEIIDFCIDQFPELLSEFHEYKPVELGLTGDDSNRIYMDGKDFPNGLILVFTEKAVGCHVIIRSGAAFTNSRISLKSEGQFVYIGNDSLLNGVKGVLLGAGDFILVGVGVSVTASSSWSTGFNSGSVSNGLVIGDHCLIGPDLVIRPADGHLVIDLDNRQQLNKAFSPVVIEPYVWIAQRAAILKGVRIGACSIVAFGAVVTKPCERFSLLAGVPAIATSLDGKIWLRNNSKKSVALQKHYVKRFFHSKDVAKG